VIWIRPLLILLLTACGGLWAGRSPEKVHALYGFDAAKPPFSEMDAQVLAETLAKWRVNTVFGSYRSADEAKALRAAGIRRMGVIGCFQGERHWKKHPESRPVTADGRRLRKVRWYAGVCPSQRWRRQEILAQAKKLARNPYFEGVWLDFIRYPVHWEVPEPELHDTCFCPVCLRKFQKETGLLIPSDITHAAGKARWILREHRTSWVDWKTSNIADFVGEVRRTVRAERPAFLVGAFVLPWGPGDHGGALTHIAGQSLEKLGVRTDVLSPMVYHSLIGEPLEWIPQAVHRTALLSRGRVWPIVLAGQGPDDMMSRGQLRKAVRSALEDPADGVLVFPQRVLAQPHHRKKLHRLFPK